MGIQGNDVVALATGGVLENYTGGAAPSAPTAPVITVEAGDSSLTVTIDSDAGVTNYVYYKKTSSSAWTAGGNRSGDGNVVIGSLAFGSYNILAYSSNEGVYSLPSNLVLSYVFDSANTIEQTLWSVLTADAGVSSIVSSRVYPMLIPQNTSLPAIAYQMISAPRQHTVCDTIDMIPSRWQFTCWATTYTSLRALVSAVRGVLDNYNGTVGSVVIQSIHFIEEVDLMNELPGVDVLRRYGKALDFYIWYNE